MGQEKKRDDVSVGKESRRQVRRRSRRDDA